MDTPGASQSHGTDEPILGLPDTEFARALRAITRPELRTADISVTCIEGTLSESISFPASGPAAFSIMIVLEGRGRTCIDGVAPLELAGDMVAVFWSDGPTSGVDQLEGNMPVAAVDVRLDPKSLRNIFGPIAHVLKNDLLVDRSNPRSGAVLVGLPLPAALIDVGRAILSCRLQAGTVRELYMRAKGLEAAALTIDALSRISPRGLHLTPRDRVKVIEARRRMEELPSEPWTIASLAQTVGLSESKLKSGFRAIVGTSIRSHLRDVRIERAALLILSGEPATEAALATGFQSLSHFSKAFREIKGIGPREFANQGSRLSRKPS